MSKIFDIIVIGGGIMGSSTAASTSETHSTILLEQFDFLHRLGSSHGNSRIVRIAYEQDEYTEMAKHAWKLWKEAELKSNEKVISQTGLMDIGEKDNCQIKSIEKNLEKHGIPFKVYEGKEINEKAPYINPKSSTYKGIYTDEGGIVDATKAVAMFQKIAKNNGAILRSNVKVVDIIEHEDEDNIEVVTSDGEKIIGKKCIVTAGAWVKNLLENSTLNQKKVTINTFILEPSVLFWKCKENKKEEYKNGPIFIDYEHIVYGFPINENPGKMKIGYHFASNGLSSDNFNLG
jgi:sarcosine oxidase / L-pipecolate oxidase